MGRSLREQLQEDSQRLAQEEQRKRAEEYLKRKEEQKKRKLKLIEEQKEIRQKMADARERQRIEQEELEEQEEMEHHLKIREVFDPFVKNFSKYFLSRREIYSMAYNEAFEWLKKESPNSKKALSKKNLMRLTGKRFLIYSKEKYTYVLARVTNTTNAKKFRIEASTITPFKTEKGLLYFLIDQGDLANKRDYTAITAITSHVFDRYSERCFKDELSRMEAIKSYCSEQRQGWVLKNEFEYIKPTTKGISLGEYTYMEELNEAGNLFLFLEKTFISSDMMFQNQGDTVNETLLDFHRSKASIREDGVECVAIEHRKGEPIYLP